MTPDEQRVIRGFAAGNQSFRESAVSSFRRALRRGDPIEGPHMLFMSEVDNPSPDLTLRGRYRQDVLGMDIKSEGK